jgi:ribosomal protein S18 acetylase RimI-like enzyme
VSGRVTIREATIEDAAAIHRALLTLAEHVGELHKVVSTADDIRRFGFEVEPPAFRTLIAEIDGAFAGMSLFFVTFSTWHGRPGVYVQDLVVEPAFRGMDVGRKLIRATARLGRGDGATHMRLTVDSESVSAKAFYDRMGLRFVPDDMIRAAFGDDFAALAADEGEGA